MTWKPKKQVVAASKLEQFWEQYGTWISGVVTAVLAVVLVVILVRRYQESQFQKAQAEVDAVSLDEPMAKMRLGRLGVDYGSSRVGPQIQLKLAQVMYRAGEYEEAEKTLMPLRGDERLSDIDRAQVELTLGYAAQERGDLVEARRCYEKLMEGKLYAAEAKHMLEVLDRMSAAPAAVETPKPPK